MTRKALPPESKRIARCVVCSPAAWAAIDGKALLTGLPAGRIIDHLAASAAKKANDAPHP